MSGLTTGTLGGASNRSAPSEFRQSDRADLPAFFLEGLLGQLEICTAEVIFVARRNASSLVGCLSKGSFESPSRAVICAQSRNGLHSNIEVDVRVATEKPNHQI